LFKLTIRFFFVFVRALRFLADLHFLSLEHAPQCPGNRWKAISETTINLRNQKTIWHREDNCPITLISTGEMQSEG
jgi:hypothetical protein